MLPENLMEEKQLDFNQPLLSVRRCSSTVASEKDDKKKTGSSLPPIPPLPYYRPELKSGPIRNPGSVPFVWEHSPGRPKDESKLQTPAFERPPTVPKLPPGRLLKVKPDKISVDSVAAEHEAGRHNCSSRSISSVEENVTKSESSRDAMEEKETSSSGDDDEAYLDARDTLSRTESFFLNCSLSDVSGLDGPEVKPSGNFTTDPQTREFMMGRFLPAAKAMISETPKHASWKQPVTREKLRQVRKVASEKHNHPLHRSKPYILPNYAEFTEQEESDNEDDGYDETGNLSTKMCGLLPRFCLLNPLPGMSMQTRAPMSPVSKTHARSPSAGSSQGIVNQRTRVAPHEHRPMARPLHPRLREYTNGVRNKSNQVVYQGNAKKLEGSSLYRRLQGSSVPLQQNGLPKSCFYEANGFNSVPKAEIGEINGLTSVKKCSNGFREISADQSTKKEIGSESPVVEKTLYVDYVQKVVSQDSNSFSSDRKDLPSFINSDPAIMVRVRDLEETPLADTLLKSRENSNIRDEKFVLQPKSVNAVNSCLLSFTGKSDKKVGMEMLKVSGQDQDLCRDSISSGLKSYSEYQDFGDQLQLMKIEDFENSQGNESKFPIPPPLPKSPSESWLWRTLPSMSSRNSSSCLRPGVPK